MAYNGSRGRAPLILNLGTRRSWVITPRLERLTRPIHWPEVSKGLEERITYPCRGFEHQSVQSAGSHQPPTLSRLLRMSSSTDLFGFIKTAKQANIRFLVELRKAAIETFKFVTWGDVPRRRQCYFNHIHKMTSGDSSRLGRLVQGGVQLPMEIDLREITCTYNSYINKVLSCK